MSETTRADERASTTESKFYLPAGYGPSAVLSRLEEIWTSSLDQRIETPT